MKTFILLACFVGLVACGGELLESTQDLFEKWAKFKAVESCFGDEVTRNYMLKLKKAHAKCMNVDLPLEAQLENSQSSTKLIKALLSGSALVERDTIAKLKDAIGFKDTNNFQQFAIPYPVAFPVTSFQPKTSNKDEEEWITEFVKKIIKRNRRQAEEVAPADAPQPDLYGLGERLNTKLTEEKAAMAAKLGNYSCILQELKVVDKDNELNLDGFLEEVKTSGIKDTWLLDTIIEDKKICYARAQALPVEVLEGCMLGPKWVKIKEFMCCCKQAKMRTCMAHDTKLKLEANFGPIDKLEAQTDMKEKEILAMAAKIVFGSMDMD